MPTFNDPVVDADEVREAVRGLAHATRSFDDPTAIHPVLGAISSALASMSQSLHQLGDFHDGPTRKQAWMNGDSHAGRASYRMSWEVHRAAEMLHQVAEAVDRAHEIEATIACEVGAGGPALPASSSLCTVDQNDSMRALSTGSWRRSPWSRIARPQAGGARICMTSIGP